MSDEAEKFAQELADAMTRPIGDGLSFPMHVQWTEPPTYTVKYLMGTTTYTTKVKGRPSFEDGDLVFHGSNGNVVRAFGRGRWLDIEVIVEDE